MCSISLENPRVSRPKRGYPSAATQARPPKCGFSSANHSRVPTAMWIGFYARYRTFSVPPRSMTIFPGYARGTALQGPGWGMV
jgi:hypothetical protein